eukprot:scaffold17.g592.t1
MPPSRPSAAVASLLFSCAVPLMRRSRLSKPSFRVVSQACLRAIIRKQVTETTLNEGLDSLLRNGRLHEAVVGVHSLAQGWGGPAVQPQADSVAHMLDQLLAHEGQSGLARVVQTIREPQLMLGQVLGVLATPEGPALAQAIARAVQLARGEQVVLSATLQQSGLGSCPSPTLQGSVLVPLGATELQHPGAPSFAFGSATAADRAVASFWPTLETCLGMLAEAADNIGHWQRRYGPGLEAAQLNRLQMMATSQYCES